MREKSPLPGLIVFLSVLWCLLLATTMWVYMVLSGSAPPPQAATGLPQATEGAAPVRMAIEVPVDATSAFKVLGSLQWWAVGLGIVLVVALGLAVLVQEKLQASEE